MFLFFEPKHIQIYSVVLFVCLVCEFSIHDVVSFVFLSCLCCGEAVVWCFWGSAVLLSYVFVTP